VRDAAGNHSRDQRILFITQQVIDLTFTELLSHQQVSISYAGGTEILNIFETHIALGEDFFIGFCCISSPISVDKMV
jgi:hypothetical protein